MTTDNDGPMVCLNWRAKLDNAPLLVTYEHPIYSDAPILGVAQYGPYQFLHGFPLPAPRVVQASLVLRCDWYWQYPHPNFSKTNAGKYHGGGIEDEVAALCSLLLGIRMRAGDATREFLHGQDPKGTPLAPRQLGDPILIGHPARRLIVPSAVEGDHSLDDLMQLETLPKMNPEDALSLVRSARLYQDALWLSESEPALTWLLLVSAVETAAIRWRSEKEPAIVGLQRAKPELHEYLLQFDNPELTERVAETFKESFGVTRKFIDFILEFKPMPPEPRPPAFALDWTLSQLEQGLKRVYDHRSKALHAGRPFPAPMCFSPHRHSDVHNAGYTERPTAPVSMNESTWLERDIPMLLHTFEYIARGTLLNWWKHC